MKLFNLTKYSRYGEKPVNYEAAIKHCMRNTEIDYYHFSKPVKTYFMSSRTVNGIDIENGTQDEVKVYCWAVRAIFSVEQKNVRHIYKFFIKNENILGHIQTITIGIHGIMESARVI